MDYCLNSDVEAEGKIEMTKYSGAIVGGRVTSGKGIEAQNVGNDTGKSIEVSQSKSTTEQTRNEGLVLHYHKDVKTGVKYVMGEK